MAHFIIMADIVDSRNHQSNRLMDALRMAVDSANQREKDRILSPFTITLGDEFQGICKSLDDAIHLILRLDRLVSLSQYKFRLRYVLYEGEIETPINFTTAYGMLGPGLTKARELLSNKTVARSQTRLVLADHKVGELLNRVFLILDSRWNIPAAKKYPEILDALAFTDLDDVELAKKFGKSRSEIWKFRQNWNTQIYRAAHEILTQGLYQ
jgi:hypothetical protein